MAALTTYGILLDSTRSRESGIEDDFSQSGQQHSRVFHSQAYYQFDIREYVTMAQFQTMEAAYEATPRATYTLTYYAVSPAVTYSVKYTTAPNISENLGGDKYIATRSLRGTKV